MGHQNFSNVVEFTITHDALRTALFDVAIPSTPREFRDTPNFQWWLECYPAGDRDNEGYFMVILRVSGKDALCKVQYEIAGDRGEVAVIASTRFRRPLIYSVARDRLLESGADVTFKCEVTVELLRDHLESSNPNKRPVSFSDTIELSVWSKTTESKTAKRPIDVNGRTVWWLQYSMEKKEDHNKLTLCLRTSAYHCDVSLTCQDVWNRRTDTIVEANPDLDHCTMTLKVPKQRTVVVKCTADFTYNPKPAKSTKPKPTQVVLPPIGYYNPINNCVQYTNPSIALYWPETPKFGKVRPSFIENRDGSTVGLLLPRRFLEEGAGYKVISEKKCCPGGFDWTIVCENDTKVDEDGETKKMIVVSWLVSNKSARAEVTYAVPQAGLRQRRKFFIKERDPNPKPIFSIDYDSIKMKPEETHVQITCNFVFPVPSIPKMVAPVPSDATTSAVPNTTSLTLRISRDAKLGVKSATKTALHDCKWWIEITPHSIEKAKCFYVYLHVSSFAGTSLCADFDYTVNCTKIQNQMTILVVHDKKKKFLFKVPADSHNLTYFEVKFDVTFSEGLRFGPPECELASSDSAGSNFIRRYLETFYERFNTVPNETTESIDDEGAEGLPQLVPAKESEPEFASSGSSHGELATQTGGLASSNPVERYRKAFFERYNSVPSEADSNGMESVECLPQLPPANESPNMPSDFDEASSSSYVSIFSTTASLKSSFGSAHTADLTNVDAFLHEPLSFKSSGESNASDRKPSEAESSNSEPIQCLPRVLPVEVSCDLAKAKSSADSSDFVDRCTSLMDASPYRPVGMESSDDHSTNVQTNDRRHQPLDLLDAVEDSYDLDKTQSNDNDSSDIDDVCNPLPMMDSSDTSYDLDETQSTESDSDDVDDVKPLPMMEPSQTTPNRDETESSNKGFSNVQRQQYMMPYY